jgi:transcriptional regulator with XRE-family HTH domain
MGDRLRAARERRGWTREELAVRSGMSWSAIAQAESGRRRNLRPDTLAHLAEPLGVSVDYLVNGGPTPRMLTHQALLYDDGEAFADGAANFLLEGLERSEPAMAITGKAHLALLRKRLGVDADRVELVDSAGKLTTPEAPLVLFTRFLTARLQEGAVWVRVLAEPIWAGRSPAQVRLWAKLESLFNLNFAGSPMSILCPYDVGSLHPAIVREAHTTHPQTVTMGKTSESSSFRDPGGFVLEG